MNRKKKETKTKSYKSADIELNRSIIKKKKNNQLDHMVMMKADRDVQSIQNAKKKIMYNRFKPMFHKMTIDLD